MKNFTFKLRHLAASHGSGTDRMRDGMAERIKTLEHVIAAKIKTINGLIFQKEGRGLIGILLKYIRGVRPRSSKSVVRQVAGFVFYISRMARHSGLKGVVIYLKACQVLLQQCVGGYRVLDIGELKVRPSRNRSGVPLIIPAGVRAKITRDRDIPSIRLWMTLLGLYRVLDFKGKLSLKTITDTGPEMKSFLVEWESFLETHFKPDLQRLVGRFSKIPNPTMFPILKSGPTSDVSYVNSSPTALIRAARIWLRDPNLSIALKTFVGQLGIGALWNRLVLVSMATHPSLDALLFSSDLKEAERGRAVHNPYPKGSGFLGKLGFKIEPAGKVRVFAMVDAWTQWVMHPIHKWLFSILKRIPQDGTFDQMAPIRRLQSKYAKDPKRKTFASIDLSAATDRLPVSMQVTLLKVLLRDLVPDSASFAEAWKDLLVKRHYSVAPSKQLKTQCGGVDSLPEAVTYAVGQPMGALSSWAMLAITHHAMMQYAFHKAFKHKHGWYEDYGVLGDDGTIVDGRVAEEYRRLLARIGVGAGMAKSIIAKSRFVIEFAKKFFVDSTTANILPIKECVATSCSTALVLEFVRKYELSFNSILSFLGFGYKAKIRAWRVLYWKLSSRLRVILVWLTHPLSPFGPATYCEWFFKVSLRESYRPSDNCIRHMNRIAEELCHKKLAQFEDILYDYAVSIEERVKTLDSGFTISVYDTKSSSVSEGGSRKSIPWKAILNPDMSSSPSEEYEFLTGGSSIHSMRFKELDKVDLGLNKFNFDDSYRMVYYLTSQLTARLEYFGLYLFEEPGVCSQIPETFWADQRKLDKPYTDFLETFRIWQAVTKPLWAEYYANKGVTPHLEEEMVAKPVPKPAEEVPMPSAIQPERGDTEAVPNLRRSLSGLKRDWLGAIRLYRRIGLLILSEFETALVGALIVILAYLAGVVPEVEEVILPSEVLQSTSEGTGDQSLLVLGLVIVLVSLALMLYWDRFTLSQVAAGLGDGDSQLIVEDPILRYQLGIQGPLMPADLQRVQVYLDSQALLDNLALSPIGDLWVDPW